MPERAYIAIGSNLGNRRTYLEAGLREVAALPNTRLAEVSRAYETPPLGPVEQPDFLNAVFAIETSLAPEPLLAALLAAEKNTSDNAAFTGDRAPSTSTYSSTASASSKAQI